MTHHPAIVSAFQFTPAQQERIRKATGIDIHCFADNNDYLQALKDAEIACGFMPANGRELAPRLRWLQTPSAGVDWLLKSPLAAPDSNVIITTAAGIHAQCIAEYVFGSMLMFNRSWPSLVIMQREHRWPPYAEANKLFRGQQGGTPELADSTLGIIGLGSIGRRIAQLGRAFGMHVIALRHSAQPGTEDPDVDELYTGDQLHELLSLSDYVVLSVPLTPRTEGMIGEQELRAMRPHAYLVNIARGKVIDEAALIRALKEGWIAGAGLDVTAQEPPEKENPLFDLPNVILTPHIAGSTDRYGERLASLFTDNIHRYQNGLPMRNRFRPDRKY
ncbi:phosphoglycerate dehydrogenase-like enzyme [Thermosporothrix hazakensis]|jgi:phosphoglycerate dehydrogenase-like enzyme|uniref:Phosphoglycerate dehydrogenase-like enzyme n=2 Tax=Thermosporothrix TaxID=768650 RepID=A0A326UF92_THEHA|nr:D-2-hydroxyacid dehydrogenase [Thermosporothrix hazakensis]PZW36541.1 phosphoglycerate dehydrogenase-like enzyme [Thermosporothrix hazakensis]BBH89008.1 hydroxyacid dehydrogenase [Thermosporothrix sp. COM3]GCE47192.1 hydroxyacid dehydrogenase [Thermosporothrix hazakensis]